MLIALFLLAIPLYIIGSVIDRHERAHEAHEDNRGRPPECEVPAGDPERQEKKREAGVVVIVPLTGRPRDGCGEVLGQRVGPSHTDEAFRVRSEPVELVLVAAV